MTETIKKNGKWVIQADRKELDRMRKFGAVSPEGIIYDEQLAGPDGMDFTLFPAKHHTPEEIEETKSWLLSTRDVVTIYIGVPKGRYPIPKVPPVWTPKQREEGFRKIVNERSMGQVEDCVTVDLFTAGYVVQIMDALSSENKEKFLLFPASKMIEITWKLVK